MRKKARKNPAAGGALAAVAVCCAWESGWWAKRLYERRKVFEQARAHARDVKRPLVVIGAPDGGITGGYPCGDFTVDLVKSDCPNSIAADITKPLPFKDDSVVVFESCTLECVPHFEAAVREIKRVSGGHIFSVRVEPWTLTTMVYPSIQHTFFTDPYKS